MQIVEINFPIAKVNSLLNAFTSSSQLPEEICTQETLDYIPLFDCYELIHASLVVLPCSDFFLY